MQGVTMSFTNAEPGPITSVVGSAREPILDGLRGFAVLGILLVNVHYMRNADVFAHGAGNEIPPATGVDGLVEFVSGWLATGKFIASFAIMFGIGAAIIADRARAAGRSERRLLARRYGVLLLFGLAHMLLIFPGDILFVYAITGFVLLPFIRIRAKTAFRWAAALIGAIAVAGLAFTGLLAAVDDPDDPVTIAMEQFFADRHTQLIDAMTAGGYGEVIVAHAWESLVIQGSQLLTLPWILALFLAGVGVARTGIIADPVRFRRPLRIAATVGLGVGLPLNLIVGAAGPAAMGSAFAPDPASLVSTMVLVAAMALGAPLLAIGYLAALALLFLRARTPRPLAAIGRTALSAYLIQNALALTVFAGFGLYERLSAAWSLAVVAAIWAALFIACPWWMRHHRYGPAEWLWRAAVYGRRP